MAAAAAVAQGAAAAQPLPLCFPSSLAQPGSFSLLCMYVRECGCIGEGLGGVCAGVGFFAHFASRNPGSSGAWAVARGGGAAATLSFCCCFLRLGS